MDFSNVNMPDILKSGMKNKFQDFPPSDFEDFIAQLFGDNNYHVENLPHSGDYGADLIISKSGEKIAVQVKRYATDNKVGVQDINQVVGAKDFYKCDKAMIITTSSFSKRGKALAGETSTELWEWDKLQKYICDTYLEGEDYYAYFGHSSETGMNEKNFGFEFVAAEFEMPIVKFGSCTLVYVKMTNLTEKNISVLLRLPTYISVQNRQVDASFWFEGYFKTGTLYAGSCVEVVFGFRTEQVPSLNGGDRFIFKWVEDEEKVDTYDLKVPSSCGPVPVKKSSCYVVTMCFGVDSAEYREMVFFRDNVLRRSRIGVWMIGLYYEVGGFAAARLGRIGIARRISRWMLKIPLMLIKQWNQHYDKRSA